MAPYLSHADGFILLGYLGSFASALQGSRSLVQCQNLLTSLALFPLLMIAALYLRLHKVPHELMLLLNLHGLMPSVLLCRVKIGSSTQIVRSRGHRVRSRIVLASPIRGDRAFGFSRADGVSLRLKLWVSKASVIAIGFGRCPIHRSMVPRATACQCLYLCSCYSSFFRVLPISVGRRILILLTNRGALVDETIQ